MGTPMLESNLSATSSTIQSASQSDIVQKIADKAPGDYQPSSIVATTASANVTISPAALALLASESGTATPAAIDYTVYFAPVRQGYNAWALMSAVSDPGAQSSSAGKTLTETAKAARASMDEKYQAMEDSGTKFNPNAAYGSDWNALMGELDRRSLLTIRENVGGLFTTDEQMMATSIMRQQQGLAMGLYSGPTEFASRFIDPFGNDNLGRMKAAAAWMDKVSDDEKQTVEWKQQRNLINQMIASHDKKPDDEDSFDYWAAIRQFAEKMRNQSKEHDTTMEAILQTDAPASSDISGLTSAAAPVPAMDGLSAASIKAATDTASGRNRSV